MATYNMDGDPFREFDERDVGGYTGISNAPPGGGSYGDWNQPTLPRTNDPGASPTYAGWQDPYRAPQPQDPYYSGWQQQFPTDPNAQAPAVGPQLGQPSSSPSAGGKPTFGGNRFDPGYINSALQYYASQPGANRSLTNDPGYWSRRISETGGLGPDNFDYWQNLGMRPEGAPENWTPSMGTNAQNWPKQLNYGGGTGVFDDPATQQYEQLLNSLIANLNQPYTPPSFGPSMDYLTKYFQQLQGPAYTPAQMDLFQTQSFDPIMQQRDASRKQLTERYGARGMAAGSGPLEAALLNSDQAYERLGTQARAGVASNAVNTQKQQQAQAAQLGPLMASLEQQNFNNNSNRQMQAAQTASIIPQMAWQRLTGAGNAIQPLNPSTLLGQQNSFQQQGYQQNSQFMSQLMQALSGLFGG